MNARAPAALAALDENERIAQPHAELARERRRHPRSAAALRDFPSTTAA